MDWLISLFTAESPAQSIFVLALVAVLGLALGKLRIFGIGVGIAGVLFAGLLFGHLGIKIEPGVMHFAREAGLLIFVYTIGLQLGPSFLASLRRQGLKLNLLAALIVCSGVGVLLALRHFLKIPMAAAAGIYTGAVTNTPGLGAAQEALRGFPNLGASITSQPGLAYAMAYPFGVVGIILSILLIRFFFRVVMAREEADISKMEKGDALPIHTANLVVRNPNLDGLTIKQITELHGSTVTFSRIASAQKVTVASPGATVKLGDKLLAVGFPEDMERLRLIVGEYSTEDLRAIPGPVTSDRILVSHREAIGKTLSELHLNEWFGVTVTRVERNGVELIPRQSLSLQIGDIVTVVGEEESLKKTSAVLGNSPKELQHLDILPAFVGVALGVLLGSVPVMFPGLPAAAKLGLAGGPLIVAMILSRIGRVGPLVWYMPPSANLVLRESGIVLFLACVGLKAGDQFVETLVHGPGLTWMLCGFVVTVVPLLLAGVVGRALLQLNYLTLSGTMAGSMTDPPALAFANSMTESNGPSLAYATVYPLTMVMRVVSAQLLILIFGPG
jgi:putative transport protein